MNLISWQKDIPAVTSNNPTELTAFSISPFITDLLVYRQTNSYEGAPNNKEGTKKSVLSVFKQRRYQRGLL